MSKFWQFKNAVGSSNPELLVYGEISEFWGEVDSKSFAEQLSEISAPEIDVRINSYGGEVWTASAIYSLLKSHSANINVFIDGIAASAATIIAMAGDKISMPNNAMMMVHNPLTMGWGNANDFREVADLLDKVRQTLLSVYREKTGLDDETLITLLDNETYMTAQEALDYGFIDEIDEQLKVAASLSRDKMVVNGLKLDAERFANMPDAWMSKKAPANKPKPKLKNTGTAGNSDEEGKKPMNLDELKAKHPDLYEQIKNEGVEAGAEQERERIKNIEEMAMPGYEDLVNKAKYEKPMQANDLAVAMVKAQKEKGKNFLNSRDSDADDLSDINAEHQGEEVDDDKEEQEIKAAAKRMANAANRKRGIK